MSVTTEKPLAQYISYPKAMKLLNERLKATPEELAFWIFLEPKRGGIAAFINANELNPPPRFYISFFTGYDYLASLMGTWFLEEDIVDFQPRNRYITGKELLERWGKQPYIKARKFIIKKIHESRLFGMHPVIGPIVREEASSIKSSFFDFSEVMKIEAEDFGLIQSELSSNEVLQKWRNESLETTGDNSLNKASPQELMSVKNNTQDNKPWFEQNPYDPEPEYSWYIAARYFAREFIRDDPTLLLKREILAKKVADAMEKVGCKKRGGKKSFAANTIKKAFSNVTLG